jgi:predicted TIM-barrel fold metal-dependent hydrolase
LFIRETIKVLDSLDISTAHKEQIYQRNAERLLGLPAK